MAHVVNFNINLQVQIAFALKNVISSDDLDPTGAELPCYSSGPGLMVRVDSELPSWWNEAWNKLKNSNKYDEVCQDLEEEHGK